MILNNFQGKESSRCSTYAYAYFNPKRSKDTVFTGFDLV